MCFKIVFDDAPDHPQEALFDTDKEVDKARERVEKEIGRELKLDWRTNFPSFTIYDQCGEEIGGG